MVPRHGPAHYHENIFIAVTIQICERNAMALGQHAGAG